MRCSGPLLMAHPEDNQNHSSNENIPSSKSFHIKFYGRSRDAQSKCNGSLLKKGETDMLCTFCGIHIIDQLGCVPHTYLLLQGFQ